MSARCWVLENTHPILPDATLPDAEPKAAPHVDAKAPGKRADALPLGRLQRVRLKDVRLESRFRQDPGDLRSLAESMATTGLAQPLLLDAEMRLVCGLRRYSAAKMLGWREISARVLDIEDPLMLSVAEDACRKDLAPSEKYAVYEALMERAKEEDWRTRALGGRLEAAARRGRLDEEIARHVKLSRESMRKIRALHQAAQEDPTKFGDLVAELDQDGRVDRHHRELLRRQGRSDAEPAAAIVVAGGWAEALERLAPKERGAKADSAILAAGAADGTLVLLPTSVRSLGDAAGLLRRCSVEWRATFQGSGEEGEALWLVGAAGKRRTVDPVALELIAEGCAQGGGAVVEAAEVATGGRVVEVSLAE